MLHLPRSKKKGFAWIFLGASVLLLWFFMRTDTAGQGIPAASVASSFVYIFEMPEVIEEAGSIEESAHPYWWLNSGGVFHVEGGRGKTIQGELPAEDRWAAAYAQTNPADTDAGAHPQNIFRLITRSVWDDFDEEVYVKINRLHMSESGHRDESNGILLFLRYADDENFYYAGLRVDGQAVIKKKKEGVYYDLGFQKVFSADAPYERSANPNLIPGARWIGLRARIRTEADHAVRLSLFMDKNGSGEWIPLVETVDNGAHGGAPLGKGYAGIRSDFFDIEFDNYKLTAFK